MKFEDEEAVEVDGPVAVIEGRRRNLAGLRVYPHPQHAQSVPLRREEENKNEKTHAHGRNHSVQSNHSSFLALDGTRDD